jgi:hypothetical protein
MKIHLTKLLLLASMSSLLVISGYAVTIESVPFSITNAGKYILDGDPTLSGTNVTAITVVASDVIIDLNGFTLKDPTGTNTGISTAKGVDCSYALPFHALNGAAHGNVFRIDNSASLIKFPAHNRLAAIRSDTKAEFEITANLQGQPVLFDFMGPGDVLDLLMSVGLYLIRMGNGDPLRP